MAWHDTKNIKFPSIKYAKKRNIQGGVTSFASAVILYIKKSAGQRMSNVSMVNTKKDGSAKLSMQQTLENWTQHSEEPFHWHSITSPLTGNIVTDSAVKTNMSAKVGVRRKFAQLKRGRTLGSDDPITYLRQINWSKVDSMSK